jgi:hypothetical protein
MAAGILIPQKGYFSDWNDPSALPGELGDSLLVFGQEDGRIFVRWCSDERCEQAGHEDITATMCIIPLDGCHAEVLCICGVNFPIEKTCFDQVN